MTFHVSHGTANAGINSTGGIHDAQETAQKQHKQRHINGVGRVAVGVIKPRCRGQHNIDKALRIGVNRLVGTRYRNLTPNLLIHGAIILSSRNHPGQRCNQNNQEEQYGVSSREASSQVFLRVFSGRIFHSQSASPFLET